MSKDGKKGKGHEEKEMPHYDSKGKRKGKSK